MIKTALSVVNILRKNMVDRCNTGDVESKIASHKYFPCILCRNSSTTCLQHVQSLEGIPKNVF